MGGPRRRLGFNAWKAAPLQLTHVNAAGEIVETKSYDMSTYGYEGYSFVSGVTADDQGLLWVAFNADSYTDLLGISLTTDELVRTIAAPHVFAQHNLPLAYADGLLYVAAPSTIGSDSLLAIDASTGAVVRDYRDTVLATLASFGSGLSDGFGYNRCAIAVADNKLLVRGPGTEASVFDAATGAHLGFLGNVPVGALTQDGSVFFGTEGVGEANEFVVSADAVQPLTVDRVWTFNRQNAHSVTVSRGLVWVLYSSGEDSGDLVAYDPQTFEAVDGFALDSNTLSGLYDSDKGAGTYAPFGLAATDDAFYLLSASGEGFYLSQRESGLHLVDYETGELEAVYSVPGINASGICHDGTDLWVLEMYSPDKLRLSGKPTFHALDPSTGLERSTFTAPVPTNGYADIACTENGLLYSGDASRLWVETSLDESGSASLSAMPLPSVGVSVVALANRLWMLDRQRNLLIIASKP